jgi:hypothetical protein
MQGVHTFCETELEGKKPLGRYRRRWEGNIEINSREAKCDGVEWQELGQGR